MSTTRNVAVLVGSLRKESFNRKLARAMIVLAPESLKLEIVEIGAMPHYNQDYETDLPQSYVDFRKRIADSAAVLFVSPEYNRSIPGVLKNAIDVGSRPSGKSVWNGKPAAIVTVSPGVLGGFGANHHLRQSIVPLNMPTLQTPEAYIGKAADLFDDKGELTAVSTREFVQKFLLAFARWIERNAAN